MGILASIQNALLFMLEYVKGVEITAVFDIAIIAFVVYKILMMVRKTSSGRVLRAILILILAMWLSSGSILKLYAVNYILSKVVEWGILALVILFQPELRRWLERVGSGSGKLGNLFTRETEQDELESCIQETVSAYTSMSKTKCGALMVFERNNLLDDVIKTGTKLDCAVSAELLKNIFWNKAPMHDGAVMVRNGRIVAAGCMLPLSSNANLSHDLGMRHRAGIGMSENSDAVVAIVSEENGSISVAVDGMLKRHLAPETLERLLQTELLPHVGETGQEPDSKPENGEKGFLSGLRRRRSEH